MFSTTFSVSLIVVCSQSRSLTRSCFYSLETRLVPSSGDSCSPEGPVLGEPRVSRQSTVVQQFLCVPSSGAAPRCQGMTLPWRSYICVCIAVKGWVPLVCSVRMRCRPGLDPGIGSGASSHDSDSRRGRSNLRRRCHLGWWLHGHRCHAGLCVTLPPIAVGSWSPQAPGVSGTHGISGYRQYRVWARPVSDQG